jgi:PTS system nitrogen regulatory IIA component
MEMRELIKPENVLRLSVGTKIQLLQDLARRAAKALDLDVQAIVDLVIAREALGSTGVGAGVAIPHTRISRLAHFFTLFARLETPIGFAAVDGQPVDLIVLLLIPDAAANDHLAALACVSRRLRDPEIAFQLRATSDPRQLYDVLTTVLPCSHM